MATYTWDSPQIDTAPSEADADSFTAFDSLTKEQVKGWVLASLDKTEEELQVMLDQQLDNLITPPIVGKTPAGW